MKRPKGQTHYIDRETWLKYLQGPSPQLRSFIDTDDRLVTSTIELVGVIDALMQSGKDPDPFVTFIKSRAKIVPITCDLMEAAIADQSESGKGNHSLKALKKVIIRKERAVTPENSKVGL